jgi:hypothetical protein
MWQLLNDPPSQWSQWVKECGGGMFHTPAGITVGAPLGSVVYGRLLSKQGDIVGVAVGVWYGCRFSRAECHVHFPSLPAVTPDIDVQAALTGLRQALGAAGAADVEVGSYDAAYLPEDGILPRLEYLVPIPPDGDVVPLLGTAHRSHVRRGVREGWTMRLLTGEEATAAIIGVQRVTAERAVTLKRSFLPSEAVGWVDLVSAGPMLPEWGLAVLAAYRDTTLLSAILIGWAGERSFYVMGGSTTEGYRCGASPWLHARSMALLAQRGIRLYNLGGTPIDAMDPTSPSHGLYRFKTGFGVTPVERRGLRWTIQRGHMAMHRATSTLLLRS